MEFMCVCSRFLFFNGKINYTVEYTYGISMWFVFAGEQTTGCLWSKKISGKIKSPNRAEAEMILEEYLETLPVTKSVA